MQFDVRQAVAAALTIGMFIMLLNMVGDGPLSPGGDIPGQAPEGTPSVTSTEDEAPQKTLKKSVKEVVQDHTPKKLWGLPGPVLQSCWGNHITGRKGKTWGYVFVKLSNGPQYHALQAADAVIVARILGATLLLPTIKEARKEHDGDFDKIYDVNHFISSLKDVVRVVGRLPEDVHSVTPTIVKIPYKVTPEYIEENVKPIFKESKVIQLVSVFSPASLKVKDSSTEEMQAIRCLVTFSALSFHSQVQKLGERMIKRVKEGSEGSADHFIAVDLRLDVLNQKGCQSEDFKSKKCFDADDVGKFLKRLGFASNTPIYLTQSRWDDSLNALKDVFPNVYTKEYSMPFNEEKQILYAGNTQLERAIDYYVCTHSDVFVPAISGIFYVSLAGERIKLGKTQILVPMISEDPSSKLKFSKVISRFVTKKDHPVYSCFCKDSSMTSKSKKKVL